MNLCKKINTYVINIYFKTLIIKFLIKSKDLNHNSDELIKFLEKY